MTRVSRSAVASVTDDSESECNGNNSKKENRATIRSSKRMMVEALKYAIRLFVRSMA